MSKKKKNADRQRQSTRQLIGIDGISEYSLLTGHGELVFFSIRPTNISVLSDSSVAARIYALMTVLKGNVCTGENDDYINLYADYNMESGQVCDELTIILWKGGGQSEERSYTLNAAEKEVLLRKMDEYCRQQTGMALTDYAAQRMVEDVPLTQPTM